jgi:8-oxo-dGTP diphosphatase
MELWDVYDDSFNKTGRTHERGKPLIKGENHLVVHIFPVNRQGELLIQRRQDHVRWSPGLWAATGGSVIAGEDAWSACKRELLEELGLEATRENTTFVCMYKHKDYFNSIWIVKSEAKLSDLKLQKEEVADARWASQKEVLKMIESGSFVPYIYIRHLFEFINNEICNNNETK